MHMSDADQISLIAAQCDFPVVRSKWSGIDPVLPMLERMRRDGAVVVVKLDGERTMLDDTGPYTVVVTGAPLGSDFLRVDGRTIEEALAWVIVRYASRVWGYRGPVAGA